MDKRVGARSEVVAKASALVKDADFKGLSDPVEVADDSDPVRKVLLDRQKFKKDDNGQDAYETRLNDSWKGATA